MNLNNRIKKLEKLTKFCRCDAPESSVTAIEFVNGVWDIAENWESENADEWKEFLQNFPKKQSVPKTDICIFCRKPFDEIALEKVKEGNQKFCEKLQRL